MEVIFLISVIWRTSLRTLILALKILGPEKEYCPKKNPKVFKNPAFLLFSIIHDLNKKFLSTDLILVSNFFRFKDHCVR